MANAMSKEERYRKLMAICHEMVSAIEDSINMGSAPDDEIDLLLNTLANPDGPGADILLNHEGPYSEVSLKAILTENK